MSPAPWMDEAHKHLGLHEVKGPKHAAEILQFWKDIKRGGIKDDETPWCAAFVGAMLERVNIRSSRFEGAASYSTWGIGLSSPIPGCIAVLKREGGGHVGFVDSMTLLGQVNLLGGNQSDEVSVRSFDIRRVTDFRWPADFPLSKERMLIRDAGQSTRES